MSELESNLGVRIRHRRTLMNMRLADLAAEVGCSESMLSKIEHGKANPSLKMLHRIAKALDIAAGALFYQSDEEDCLARKGTRPLLSISTLRSGTDIVLEALIPHAAGRLLASNIHIVQPGGHTDGEYTHEGEDLGYILEGQLELHLDDKVHILNEGDSFYFQSDKKHGYRNPGTTVAKVLWVNTPPSF
ncbi:helix-turn-helix domain-containing protein [Desulfocurvus sp. DL9XJH121]